MNVALAILGALLLGLSTYLINQLPPVGDDQVGRLLARLPVVRSMPRTHQRTVLFGLALVSIALLIFAGTQLVSHVGDSDEEGNFIGGCQPFTVFAQNRWDPRGAALRVEPSRDAQQIGNFDPNQLVVVNGWVRTRAAYPSNSPPFNNDIWFHVADGSGWVAFGAVRADPTTYDPTGFDPDGGRPAPIEPTCSGSYR
jgi:hypothetical protein